MIQSRQVKVTFFSDLHQQYHVILVQFGSLQRSGECGCVVVQTAITSGYRVPVLLEVHDARCMADVSARESRIIRG